MSDPRGDLCMIHTPLVVWIADYPEQLLITCTASKCSLISLAVSAQFGDPFPHSPQTTCTISNPCDIPLFYKTFELYWMDWDDAYALYQWHNFFFDHLITWSINIMGGAELNHQLSALQPWVGVHHWVNGHQDLEKLLSALIVGTVPNDVACALCAITEFIFQAQNLFLYEETLHSLTEALHEFYHHKASIITAGGCHGKNELMQHVTQSTCVMGAPYQWSSDITKHCHITHVKRPYHMTNHKDFYGQCCRFLDRQENYNSSSSTQF
ncbi:uncharacterized protein EDB93DRAFT_1241240 [Suillus bovinus]|uniref:uncharacterized protein n=1 Tax=Suillus bovinus TaxID=48563 RepID=UPI001B861E28|nr:uncharacterized protein EDB93DRAFT_1241240 [Suillus bovinus]KAG2144682.1 hypothetical protein EDB93DRAFT_1241240 [Suillus bovinus]